MKFFNQYDLKGFLNKDEFNIFNNFIKRNFKEDFIKDVEKDTIKKNIKHYSIEKVGKVLQNKLLKHNSDTQPIHKIFTKFCDFYNIKYSKPKYQRKNWKQWYEIKERIKQLKKEGNFKDVIELKQDKAILGQYLSLRETKSKKLDGFVKENKDVLLKYNIQDKRLFK